MTRSEYTAYIHPKENEMYTLMQPRSDQTEIYDLPLDSTPALELRIINATVQTGNIFAEENLGPAIIASMQGDQDTEKTSKGWAPLSGRDNSSEIDMLWQRCDIEDGNSKGVSDFCERSYYCLAQILQSIGVIESIFGEEVQISLEYIDDKYEGIRAMFCTIITTLDADSAYKLFIQFEETWLEIQSNAFQDNVIYTLDFK